MTDIPYGSQPPRLTTSDADPVGTFEYLHRKKLTRDRWVTAISLTVGAALLAWAFDRTGFTAPGAGDDAFKKIGEFLIRMNPELQADQLFADQTTEGSIAYWFIRWPFWRDAMIETLQMAFLGTVLSGFFGLLAAFMTASTTMPYAPVRWAGRRFLELIRTMPDLIMAIIFVALFGLGPFAGLLTLVLSGTGGLGRYFADMLEDIDERPRAAIRAAGGGVFQQLRFGVYPQISMPFMSLTFLRFEFQVSSATTLGLVGAGGIGQELIRALNFNQYQSYLAILVMIVMVIIITDLVSEYVRHRMAKVEAML